MEYIKVSSLVYDFWGLFFFPLIRISLFAFLMRYILGKGLYNKLKLKLFKTIEEYSQRIKYREKLDKAAPIVSIFLLFSFIYMFSMLCSTIESFIPLNISFASDNHLSRGVVLNVWEYYPYIEDFDTLQNVVYYKASESELDTSKLLSTEGLRNLPEMLLRSSIVFVIILLSFLIILLIVKIYKRGFLHRVAMILRAILALFMLIFLFAGVSFLNRNYINDYRSLAWGHLESQLLSSGAPPESEINIKKEKTDEVDYYCIDNNGYYDFNASVVFGPASASIIYTDHHFEFYVYSH